MSTGSQNSDNVFSQRWNDSDVVLVVEGKEVHVHRYMLSMQSPVFKAMFNGNFKDSKQEKIELKDDKYETMLLFLQLLYPPNMLDENKSDVDINDENILQILEVADKYTAINIIKQCMKEAENLEPEITMRLLPYASRHDLPLDEILEVIGTEVSTKELENYAPELGDDRLYIQTLVKKCHSLEKLAKQAYTLVLFMLDRHFKNGFMDKSVRCSFHGVVNATGSFEKIRNCRRCLKAYQKFINKCVFSHDSERPLFIHFESSRLSCLDFVDFLKTVGNIETSV
ncbi:kelch 40a [Paramuricea clavata]|uniref:Kelch 40a n=1 Tax=Paramuricea clavata TaxID=317549 RepID=A0A7D9LB50_PARCT|nr:kelch 40a [Paramuricea clavata]